MSGKPSLVSHIDFINLESGKAKGATRVMAEFFQAANENELLNLDRDGVAVILNDVADRIERINERADALWDALKGNIVPDGGKGGVR